MQPKASGGKKDKHRKSAMLTLFSLSQLNIEMRGKLLAVFLAAGAKLDIVDEVQ